jgi:protein tyrosine phosphatase (PTP) superfamily phosphohydrolase (DUF442 family)
LSPGANGNLIDPFPLAAIGLALANHQAAQARRGRRRALKKKFWLRRWAGDLSDDFKRARGRMDTPKKRLFGHVESLFIDHAFIRLAYLNRHALSDKMFRAAQPTPGQIRRLAATGIKTIINLRGARDCASYILEEEACRRHGVTLVNFPIKSRDMPSKENLRRAREIFATIEYPALLHCKSGADRAGLMSVLYLMLHEGLPAAQALKQLSWRYGHIKQAKTGMLDYFFELYLAADARAPIAFFDWVDQAYDPDQARAGFTSGVWASRLVDDLLARE